MIAQCKGKDINNISKSKLLQDGWYPSIKYDGNYVQIEKIGSIIKFWTSGGKQFYIDHIADELLNRNPSTDFIVECEYIGSSKGKLGDRTKAAKLTTYRTDFNKGLKSNTIPGNDIFKVFDCIYYKEYEGQAMVNFEYPFKVRKQFLNLINFGTNIEPVSDFEKSFNLNNIKVKPFIDEGYEGLFLKHKSHMYEPGKRVNLAIKLKLRPTADLLCIGYEEGTGKYSGMIGSLILVDSYGREVNVGSGLSDYERNKNFEYFKNKIVEIEYEQIIDTYIQPTFIRVREDKTKGD